MVGDYVFVADTVGSNAWFSFRPNTGDEVVLMSVGSSHDYGSPPAGGPDVRISFTDGSNRAHILNWRTGSHTPANIRIPATHDNYLAIENRSDSSAYICVAFMYTKEV
ncbi:MAG: hypothetical protein QXQ02_03135 [Halobacteria archaeon]